MEVVVHRKRTSLALGLTVAAVAVTSSGAVAGLLNGDSTDPGLGAKDYNEVSQLYALYAIDVDPGSPRNASWLFTDDGEFFCPAPSCGASTLDVKGRDNLDQFYEGVRQRQAAGTRHFNTTFAMTKTQAGATSTGYLLIVARHNATDPWVVTGVGTYEDYLVRTPNGWRIKKRIFRADTFQTDTVPHAVSPIG
jgi:hypothetical protein